MKYEGHFLIWYLLLMPFAKLGFPYITSNIISWLITSISVWLILHKAPFKFYKRVLLICSFPLVYLYPVVSRCYCLIPLAIVFMCMFYKDRKEKPYRYLLSVVLLENTHVIMLGMVGIVLLEYICEFLKDFKNFSAEEKKKKITCLIIIFALLVISILPLLFCLTTNRDLGSTDYWNVKLKIMILSIPEALIKNLFCFMDLIHIDFYSSILIIIIIVLFLEIKNNPLMCLKIWGSILWQSFIHVFIYKQSLQRVATIIFILLYFKWVNIYRTRKKHNYIETKSLKILERLKWSKILPLREKYKKIEKKLINICWIILLSINIIQGVLFIWSNEIMYKSSNAYQMGEYINNNSNDNSIILTGPRVEFTTSVIPYIKKGVKFYHLTGERFFSYAILDDKNNLDLQLDDIKKIPSIFNKEQKIYYIDCEEKYNPVEAKIEFKEKDLINECLDKGIFKKLYFTEGNTTYLENFVLYEVNLENINNDI